MPLTSPDSRQQVKEMVLGMSGAALVQLKMAVLAFVDRDEQLAHTVIEKDNYVDNLYVLTESRIFKLIQECSEAPKLEYLRTALKMAKALEKVADHAENIAKQSLHIVKKPLQPSALNLRGGLEKALIGIEQVVQAFLKRDIEMAEKAGRTESVLDDVYTSMLHETLEWLTNPGQDVGYRLTELFAAKQLEKIGDAILDMAEAVLTMVAGERLKMHQASEFSRLFDEDKLTELSVEGFWGTKSGSSTFKLETGQDDTFIYKEGTPHKIQKEVDCLERWNRIIPNLVPQVLTTKDDDKRQVMLYKYLQGVTLFDIYNDAKWFDKAEAVTDKLLGLLDMIWTQTYRPEPAPFTPMHQLRKRLDATYFRHRKLGLLRNEPASFCGIEHPPLEDLIRRAEVFNDRLATPFTVFIHGDFNNDNLLFRQRENKIQFIDVYRSTDGDYLQDISVLLASNLRMPIHSDEQMTVLESVNSRIIDFTRGFAAEHGDTLFEERLCLMMARSLITATRFVVNYPQTKRLFLQGVLRLERALARLEA